MDCKKELPLEVRTGIRLFNRGCFFEAHEELETAWRAEPGDNRYLYQGILQLGVGYYHLINQNTVGARKLFFRAQKTLEDMPPFCQGIDVTQLRKQIKEATDLVESITTQPFMDFHFPIYPIEIGQINHE